jgi:hypothetical protein
MNVERLIFLPEGRLRIQAGCTQRSAAGRPHECWSLYFALGGPPRGFRLLNTRSAAGHRMNVGASYFF